MKNAQVRRLKREVERRDEELLVLDEEVGELTDHVAASKDEILASQHQSEARVQEAIAEAERKVEAICKEALVSVCEARRENKLNKKITRVVISEIRKERMPLFVLCMRREMRH